MDLSTEALAARVQQAVRTSGLTQQQLADRIGVDPTALSKALGGKRNFKPLELALIAEQLGLSIQQLLADDQDENPGEAVIAARAQADASPAVDGALDRVQRILDLDQLLSELGFPGFAAARPSRMPSATPSEQGERLAAGLRERLGIGTADLPAEVGSLATYVEDELDIDVAIEPLSPGLDGLAVSRPGFQLILVSSSVSATRQRYTLAHELGHLLAGDGSRKGGPRIQVDENIMGARSPAETRANAFAAAFLMPAEALRAACGGHAEITQQLIGELLGRYRVSLDALAFRLHNAGLISGAQREDVRRMSSARIAMRQGRASDLQARRGRRWPDGLLSRALEAYARAEISIRPIAQLLEVDEDVLLDELAPIQLGPAGHTADDDLVPFL